MQVSEASRDPPDAACQEALVLAIAQERDRDAFARLFAHYAPRLKAYLVRLGAEPPAAEELAQEAMIMVWRRAHSFDPAKSSVATWLFTIARNKRIDALRRERRPQVDPSDPMLVPEGGRAADAALAAVQDSQRLGAAIACLPPEQAELIRLAYFEDMAHGAIAAATALPLGTVKSRLRLAMAQLRRALKE